MKSVIPVVLTTIILFSGCTGLQQDTTVDIEDLCGLYAAIDMRFVDDYEASVMDVVWIGVIVGTNYNPYVVAAKNGIALGCWLINNLDFDFDRNCGDAKITLTLENEDEPRISIPIYCEPTDLEHVKIFSDSIEHVPVVYYDGIDLESTIF
tara:strand:- start:6 stop:458 length:453 start_codon:yes stop_codon:yes gene_type:complete